MCACVRACVQLNPCPPRSSLSWNTYHAADIIAADYDGVLTMYDASTGQRVRAFQVSLISVARCIQPLPPPVSPSHSSLLCSAVLLRSMRREHGASTSVPPIQTSLCQPRMTAEVSGGPACQQTGAPYSFSHISCPHHPNWFMSGAVLCCVV